MVFEMCEMTDKQTDIHTLVAILRAPNGGEVICTMAWKLIGPSDKIVKILIPVGCGFVPSEYSRRRKNKIGVGADSPLTSCVHGKPGQEARVTSVYLMQDWTRGSAQHPHNDRWTVPRRGSLARIRCGAPFLGNGLGDRAQILGIFKPVCLECQTRVVQGSILCDPIQPSTSAD